MKTIETLIDSIYINEANVERVATTGIISGRLRSEIRRVMTEWAEQEVNVDRKERLLNSKPQL